MSFLSLRSNHRPLQLNVDPLVTTQAATSIATTSVTGNGTVVQDGGSTDTVRGFVYSSSNSEPTLSDSVQTAGSGLGAFTASLSGLSSNTTYYYRAYATNAIGTGYGDTVIFTTSAGAAGAAFIGYRTLLGIGM